MHFRSFWLPLLLAATTACGADLSTWMTPDQLRRAEQLTSLFENDTPEIQYSYCSDLGDGRGLTVGRAGFTTSNDEVYQVLQAYTAREPANVLVPFLPVIKKLADDESEETSGLHGFKKAWKTAAKDPVFCAVQDEIAHRLYLTPVIQWTTKLGLQTALARAVIYDTMIQHGDDGDPDSLGVLIEKTNKLAGGTPATGIDEKSWLKTFLTVRRADLAHSFDPASRKEWAKSVVRCDAFSELAAAGNYDLHGPLVLDDKDRWETTIP